MWIACSTDWETEVIDLAELITVPLVRNVNYPQRVRNNIYRQNLHEDSLEACRTEAQVLASLLGAAVAQTGAAARAIWFYSDTAHDQLSEQVPGDIVSNPTAIQVKDSVALVRDSEES